LYYLCYLFYLIRRKVSLEDAIKYKEENKLDYVCETSAKTGYNAKAV